MFPFSIAVFGINLRGFSYCNCSNVFFFLEFQIPGLYSYLENIIEVCTDRIKAEMGCVLGSVLHCATSHVMKSVMLSFIACYCLAT